jgi:hypothetical protein
MTNQPTSRRCFVRMAVPACFVACAGLRALPLAAQSEKNASKSQDQPPQTPRHKFDEPISSSTTYRQRFTTEYASHLIPYLKILDREIGRPKVIATLRQLALQEAKEYADYIKANEKADLAVFKRHYSPTTPGMKNMITIEVLNSTDTVYEIKITECLWAKVFQDAGAAEYGVAAVCSGDVPFARFIDPSLDLDLTGTIMEGKPACILRYHVKA